MEKTKNLLLRFETWMFPLMSGLFVGWLCMVFVEAALERRNNQVYSAAVTVSVSKKQNRLLE